MKFIFLIALLVSSSMVAQERFMIVHDVFNKTVDTIPFVDYDKNVIRDKTDFSYGNYNNEVEQLPEKLTDERLYKESRYTWKRKVSDDYDITKYPFRTSVKLFFVNEGEFISSCSGSLIGQKHVLLSAHCIAKRESYNLINDSLFITPIFDNNEFNKVFEGSFVKKIYISNNWFRGDGDFAILELEKSIGSETGWISFGFDNNDTTLQDGIFYKFSYPGMFWEPDSIDYDSSDLYYSFGKCNFVYSNSIGSVGTSGVPGESGSSFIKLKNNIEYTTYGVLNWSSDLKHSRIMQEHFYTFKSIIDEDFITDVKTKSETEDVSIYPNPVVDKFSILSRNNFRFNKIEIVDISGRKILEFENYNTEDYIDMSNLDSGNYFLRLVSKDRIRVVKFIKL
jgi:hypothetical protein